MLLCRVRFGGQHAQGGSLCHGEGTDDCRAAHRGRCKMLAGMAACPPTPCRGRRRPTIHDFADTGNVRRGSSNASDGWSAQADHDTERKQPPPAATKKTRRRRPPHPSADGMGKNPPRHGTEAATAHRDMGNTTPPPTAYRAANANSGAGSPLTLPPRRWPDPAAPARRTAARRPSGRRLHHPRPAGPAAAAGAARPSAPAADGAHPRRRHRS